MAETIDSQRQYILFLEKKVSDMLNRMVDLQLDLSDARLRNDLLVSKTDRMDALLYAYEQKEYREANDGR